MGPLPGALREACESHVPALAKRGTPQDRKHNITTHPAGVLYRQQAQALDRAWVSVWGPLSGIWC